MTTSVKLVVVVMDAVVLVQFTPPSVERQTPKPLVTPLNPRTDAAKSVLESVGCTTIREMARLSKAALPTRDQVAPASVDFRMPRP